jgi:hypothetical protein
MPIEIVTALAILFGLFGLAFMFQPETRLFAACCLIIVGGLVQWIENASTIHEGIQEELGDVLPVYELQYKEATVHVIYHEDKVIVLEKELQQEIKSEKIQALKKSSNFSYGIYFNPKTKYVQKN